MSNRSTPRRTSVTQQQRSKPSTTLRRSISMEELGSRQPTLDPRGIHQKDQTALMRTNSVTRVPQCTTQVQYTSPLQEVQRRVLSDFAAHIQSTFNQQERLNETDTWERESIDSLEASNHYHPQQVISPPKITGPIVRQNHVINVQTKKSSQQQQPITKNFPYESSSNSNRHDMLRRSYHESFFVKNTPVTGDEQVTAWLGINKNTAAPSNKHIDISSANGNEGEINGRRKSILKRSPSLDSNTNNSVNNAKPITETRKTNVLQARTIGDKVHVKDSLEVMNTKLLKELDVQVKNFVYSILIKRLRMYL